MKRGSTHAAFESSAGSSKPCKEGVGSSGEGFPPASVSFSWTQLQEMQVSHECDLAPDCSSPRKQEVMGKNKNHLWKRDRQGSNMAWPAWMGKFQGLTVSDKPKNLLQRDAWLGLGGAQQGAPLDCKWLLTQPSGESTRPNCFTAGTPGSEHCGQQHKVQLAARYSGRSSGVINRAEIA